MKIFALIITITIGFSIFGQIDEKLSTTVKFDEVINSINRMYVDEVDAEDQRVAHTSRSPESDRRLEHRLDPAGLARNDLLVVGLVSAPAAHRASAVRMDGATCLRRGILDFTPNGKSKRKPAPRNHPCRAERRRVVGGHRRSDQCILARRRRPHPGGGRRADLRLVHLAARSFVSRIGQQPTCLPLIWI